MFLSGRGPMTSRIWISAVGLAVSLGVAIDVQAQGRGGRAGGGPPATGRAAAAQDLTGTWVSVVTEHWHLRMLVPPKGDFSMLPLNPEARKIAMSWDPAKDQAEGRPRAFVDGWNTGGQHTWVNLGEVVAFSLRPAK